MVKTVAAIMMFAVLVCIWSCAVGMQIVSGHTATVEIVSLDTNKPFYHLGENMEIVLVLYSDKNINNVTVKVSGLRGRHGKDLVSLSKVVNLTSGENKIVFQRKIPSCGCAVSYGDHFINASVAYDGIAVNATHSIVLAPRGETPYIDISVEEAKRMIDNTDVILLDVRTAEEYNEVHIKGAKLIPLSELCNRTEELNKSKKIVVYCRSGDRSAEACDILVDNGFKKVYNVVGGLNAWMKKGYPVVHSSTSSASNSTSSSSSAPNITPGFEIVLAIAAITAWIWVRRLRRDE